MAFELYLRALERTIADLVKRFADTPDLYWREAELHAACFRDLHQHSLLTTLYSTRDGRRTGLVHAAYPPLQAYAADDVAGGASPAYDLALLNPSFVRTYPLALVANAEPGAPAIRPGSGESERPTPLMAVVQMKLIADDTPATLAMLEASFYALVRAEPDAERAYLVVFCRHWDVNGPARTVLPRMERWAANQPSVSLVYVQAHADDIGRLWGGRYLNLWSHTAALPPLCLRV